MTMFDSHIKSSEAIREVIQLHPERDLSDEMTSNGFMRKLKKHMRYLTPLKKASTNMQAHLATLENSQFQCDLIGVLAAEGYKQVGHDFEHCKINPNNFLVDNPYDSNMTFISAVIKVQSGKEDELLVEEAKVIGPWKLIEQEGLLSSSQDGLEEESLSAFECLNRERHRKKQLMQSGNSKLAYNPALKYCVLGSAAEAERVWSMAGHVLTNACSSLSPLVFELIMYLKYYACLWTIDDVIEANRRRKNESPAAKKQLALQKERLQKLTAELNDWSGGEEKGLNAIEEI